MDVTFGSQVIALILVMLPIKYVKTLRSDSAELSEYLVLAILRNRKQLKVSTKKRRARLGIPGSWNWPCDPSVERGQTKRFSLWGLKKKVLHYHLNAGDCILVSFDFRPRDLFVACPYFRKPKFSATHVYRSDLAARVLAAKLAFVAVMTMVLRHDPRLHVVLSVVLTWIWIRWRDKAG